MPILLGTIFLISQKIGDVRYAAVKGEDNLYSIKTSSSWQFVWNFYSKDKIVRLLYMVSMLWLMVTFVIVIRGLWINCKIQGMLAERISLIDNCNVKKGLEFVGKKIDLSKEIPIYWCKHLDTPILSGIFFPKIYLDRCDYSDEECGLILFHELVHYKKKDILFRGMSEILWALYWFNPIIIRFVREFYTYCEIGCDKVVVSNITHKEKIVYAKLIGEAKTSFVSIFSESTLRNSRKNIIVRRLSAMLLKKKSNRKIVVIATMIMALSCPFISLASIKLGVEAGDVLMKKLDSKYEMTLSEKVIKETLSENNIEKEEAFVKKINLRGINTVDDRIESGSQVVYGAVDLDKGAAIGISIFGDNDSDKFVVSLINEEGRARSVSAVSGAVVHTFNIAEKNTYYIRITNKSNTSINGSGSISIRE